MPKEFLKHNPIKLLNELSEIPFKCKNLQEALQLITELGRDALDSHACTLSLVDIKNRTLTLTACASCNEDFKRYMSNLSYKVLKNSSYVQGDFIDFELFSKGEVIEKYDLQSDGQGIANPEIAKRFNLSAALCYPLKSNGQVIGYFNHFSSMSYSPHEDERNLLEIFARQAVLAIERFEHHRMLNRSLRILNDLSQNLFTVSSREFLNQITDKACELLSVPTCIVWKLDKNKRLLNIVSATEDVDEQYRKIKLDLNELHIQPSALRKKVTYIEDVSKPHPMFKNFPEAQKRGWVSFLRAPMWAKGTLIGILNVYTQKLRHFKEWEIELFTNFANHAAISMQKAEDLEILRRKEKLKDIMQQMTEARSVDEILELIIAKAKVLVNFSRGWVCRLDINTGEMIIVAPKGDPLENRSLRIEDGISGKALREERAIRVEDVRAPEWEGIYKDYWPDTRSELVIPIFIPQAEVRIGIHIELRSKPIGVLNIESSKVGAFSDLDEELLCSLIRQAAIRIERLEYVHKLKQRAQIEKEIVGKRDWDDIFKIISNTIINTFGFQYVNISLVIKERNCIQTAYFVGIPESEVEEFRKTAVHSLNSSDIQADLVRTQEIEVPGIKDKRFDQKIYERFRHDQLIRVFIPMIVPSENQVIGTVEAGYPRKYREYIYEQDIQILKSFIDYVVLALVQGKKGLLEQIKHEFRSALVGIKSNASFLQRRIHQLPAEIIKRKFDDVILDANLLLFQVKRLEYILGGISPDVKIQKTLVFRDIIIKTLKELKPIIIEHRLDPSLVGYNSDEKYKIDPLYVDRAMLNQVVYNLLINAIKYAEDDRKSFSMRIEVETNEQFFIIKFQDWGIGVNKKFEEKIFQHGFRTPEAIQKHIFGSGLGLTISRKIMRFFGGDLILSGNRKPTEFQILLPKSLKEYHDDPLRR